MRTVSFPILAILLFFGPALRSWAQIPRPTDAPQPRSPEETAASFRLPKGFRMDVVASEPLIASPSGVCWDERGRMFVSELHGYNLAGELDIEDLNKTGKLDTEVRRVQAAQKFKEAAEAGTFGVIKLLTDTNGDGRMDRAAVWATNLPPAYGLVPARGGIIAACAPHIIYFADRNKDGKAETREVLFTGFPTGELERGINAPQWGDDGWIYFGRGWGGGKITGPHLSAPVELPGSDFRIRADGSAIEAITGQTHTFSFAMTGAGDRFTVTTTVPGIYVAPLPWRYLARNPDLAAASLEAPTGDRRAYSISKPHPWRQRRADDPAYFKFYNSRYGAAESEANGWFTAACGPLIYRDNVLPGLQGQYFVCEPAGNLIHRAAVQQDGSLLKLVRVPGEEKSEFAATDDAWSHPMNLSHGPDGSIWITDYYREIIEDYSAIPRHLQQQYGVYSGHDRGRIYRLSHNEGSPFQSVDLDNLATSALVQECRSPIMWRRQTAQRLLRERNDRSAAAELKESLPQLRSPDAIITVLYTLDQIGTLSPNDLRPFVIHSDPAVRIRALQLADRWLSQGEGRELLNDVLAQAEIEADPRVQIQFALSLGETSDARTLITLAHYAREHLRVRWMETAVLSSLHGRGLDMLRTLLVSVNVPAPFLVSLAETISARREDSELGAALQLLDGADARAQAAVLNGLVKGRKNAPHRVLQDKSAVQSLAALSASADAEVRNAARSLSDIFPASAPDDEAAISSQVPAPVQMSDESFRKFVVALDRPRNVQRGQELFLIACATCHRIESQGNDVGPDLRGQIGIVEESLLKEILLPSERIRPGYETTHIQTRDGGSAVGILKTESASSVTLVQAGGLERVILRKDIVGVRRLATSIMPSFSEALSPQDAADLLGWLRGR